MIFRELFLKGLTLLDLREGGMDINLQMSHLAAREEVRLLLEVLKLEEGPETLPEVDPAVGTPHF